MSAARLVLELVGESAPAIELPRSGVLTLGSAQGRADVLLGGQGVADVHCAIGRAKGGGWAIKDLGSSYGTIVNGERVQTAKLSAGDQIVLGSRRLRVVDPAAAASQVREPAPDLPGSRAPTPRAGDGGLPQVSGYRLEGRLGRGGMGQVFLAVQESLQRRIALKVLADKLAADADFVRRFQAEARAAAALNHPNVVTVHDVWEEGGRHWLAMEYMDRGTLEARVAAEGRLPWRQVLDVLSDAAKGLVYAELRGIVHRDIKPANLMQNEVGTTKIADLGLATHLEAEATDEGDRKIFGTPHFISPEQARGERVDARSDLYSLGATAYRLLTGHTPFEGANTREILRGHFFEAPEPVVELAPDVPRELDAVVLRLLAKKPQERFPSAGALLQELERLRSVLVHGVGPSAAPAPAAASGGRRGLLVAAVVVVLAALLGWRLLTGGDPAPTAPPSGPGVGPSQPAPGDGAPVPRRDAPPEVTSQDEPAQPPPFSDDESALQRLEEQAELAWRALPGELSDAERRDELRRLAREHAGSTWAARFESEALALDRRLVSSQAAAQLAEQAAADTLAELRAAVQGAEGARPLGPALAALLAVEIPPGLLADDGFRPRWLEVWREVVRGADERGRAALRTADQQASEGHFDLVESTLALAQASLSEEGAPQLPTELAAPLEPLLEQARATRSELTARLAGLDHTRARFERAQVISDRGAIAAAARGPGGLERELRAFDVEAARNRLSALEAQLASPARRAEVSAWREDLQAAQAAFASLAGAWPRDGWKRRTVNDPRSRGRANREAVGADGRGVLLKDGDQAELVPWSEFCGRPLEVHQLFLERLERAYSAEELQGIEALMRLSAVLQAVEEAAEMLEAPSGQVFTEEEARGLLEGFELAGPWAEQAGTLDPLAREAAAADLLASALRAITIQRWDESATLLERLLAEHRDTLLVRLLSDGRDLAGLPPAPLPEVPPGQPADTAPPVERDG